MLTASQINSYRQNGYLVLENLIPDELLQRLRQRITHFTVLSAGVESSNEMFDIDSESSDLATRLRRLKDPHKHDPLFWELASSDLILDPISQLLGGTVRFDHSKLNFKYPGVQANISWHQDWAFYPHTNDDMLAVGVMIEDCTLENGPLRVIPGSHKGPIYDHHHEGTFVGSISDNDELTFSSEAVDLLAPAGSLSIHHVRTLHASSNCTGNSSRPLLLFSYSAVDAFPVFSAYDLDEFDSRILRGAPVREARMESLPVRLHLPRRPGSDSIYDNQAARNSEN